MMTALSASSTSWRSVTAADRGWADAQVECPAGRALGVGEEPDAVAELGERADIGTGDVANAHAVHRIRRDVDRRMRASARITSLCTASQPSTSSDGSASANPRRWASASALPKLDTGVRIAVRMTLVVPLITQSSAETRSPSRLSRSSATMGSPAPTLASNYRCAPCSAASALSRGPDAAITALFAVTTDLAGAQRRLDERGRRVGAAHRLDHDRHSRVGDHSHRVSATSLTFFRSTPRVRDSVAHGDAAQHRHRPGSLAEQFPFVDETLGDRGPHRAEPEQPDPTDSIAWDSLLGAR